MNWKFCTWFLFTVFVVSGIVSVGAILLTDNTCAQAVIPYSRMGLTQDQTNACAKLFNRPAPITAKRDMCTEFEKLMVEFCN